MLTASFIAGIWWGMVLRHWLDVVELEPRAENAEAGRRTALVNGAEREIQMCRECGGAAYRENDGRTLVAVRRKGGRE